MSRPCWVVFAVFANIFSEKATCAYIPQPRTFQTVQPSSSKYHHHGESPRTSTTTLQLLPTTDMIDIINNNLDSTTTTTITTTTPPPPLPSILISGLLKEIDPEEARGRFWFQFVAANGALTIGLSQIPKILAEINDLRSLKSVGPTQEGGEDLDASFLATLFYPEPLCRDDVDMVIRAVPPSKEISQSSASGTYMASLGYVDKQDFISVVEGSGEMNPLAVRAVFDAVAGGKGASVDPAKFDEKLGKYKGSDGLDLFKDDLQSSTVVKLTSYGGFLFLILLIFDVLFESAMNGFFGQ